MGLEAHSEKTLREGMETWGGDPNECEGCDRLHHDCHFSRKPQRMEAGPLEAMEGLQPLSDEEGESWPHFPELGTEPPTDQ